MTTACAFLGGLPMILGRGTGSEFRQPLGWAIVGGLVVSQILTLFSTPVIYIYLDRLRRRFERVQATPPTESPTTESAVNANPIVDAPAAAAPTVQAP